MGRVEAMWIKRVRRGPMDPADQVSLVAGKGIDRDSNFGRGQRQVTVIEKEVFDRLAEQFPEADPGMRRANVMVSGVRLKDTRGQVLRLGSVRLLVKGETRPCERMDEQCGGLSDALDADWNGGLFAIVLDDGVVRVGDEATLEADVPASA